MKNLLSTNKQVSVLILILLLNSVSLLAQEQKTFGSINEVFNYTKTSNLSFKNAELQIKLAEITKKIAIGNIFNPKIPTSAQALNNINQQISFLPGQAFGLPANTFKEVTIGQQFVSTFSVQPQFDIINMSSFSQIKSAKINQQLTENQNKINEQNLYEKISLVYFNILSFNGQKEILEENIIHAKDIFRITENKFTEGIARKQEVNEAESNLILLKDKLEQIEINTKIQYQILNLFFENQIKSNLSQVIWSFENTENTSVPKNNLIAENARLQSLLAKQEYRTLGYQNLPVLSFISAFNWQNSSNEDFFSKNSNWINYSYLGLKLSYDFPTTVQKVSNLKNKQIQINVLKNNEAHILKENENRNVQLFLEYEKAINQRKNFQRIFELKKETYEKNFNQFKENVLPLDRLLISQNDMLISKLNLVSTLANIGFNKIIIEINK